MSANSTGSNGTLVGDSNLRVTVPLPRNLNDLRGAATRHFRGAKGLYHHGRHEMTHPHHVSGLKHGDTIVVALDDGPKEALPISTHAAHYIKYDVQAPRPIAHRSTPPPNLPFEGESRYTTDYIKHPMEVNAPVKPKPQWDDGRNGVFMGKSTYASHYPWHNPQRALPIGPRHDMTPNTAPFEGTTSYARDFVQHPLQARHQRTAPPRAENAGPFEGVTTYNVDFKKHPFFDRTGPAEHRQAYIPNTGPFEGATEYNREYLKHQMEAPVMVHIEPEMRGTRRSRPKSAPGRGATGRPRSTRAVSRGR